MNTDDLTRELEDLHQEQIRLHWRVAYANHYSKEVERHYMARLVRLLRALGIGPVVTCGANDPVDLIVDGVEVEVKVARPRRKKRRGEYYQALLHDKGNRHRLDGDLVLVLCVSSDDQLFPYVIPREAVGDRRTVEITSHPADYAGQWADFLQAWDYFEGG